MRALALVAVIGVTACRGKPRSDAGSAAPSGSSTTPADRLAPGEPAPGQEKVHELLLPRGAKIERRFGNSTYVHVPHSPEATANWIRRYSDDADGVVGPNGTVFAAVHVKGAARSYHLRIEITGAAASESSAMVVDYVDDTKPTLPPTLSNEELMKKAGLTPDGKILDPKHIE